MARPRAKSKLPTGPIPQCSWCHSTMWFLSKTTKLNIDIWMCGSCDIDYRDIPVNK